MMTISNELLDELLKGCKRPEDLLSDAGLVTGKGREKVDRLRSTLERDEEAADLPAAVHHMAQICFAQIDDLSRRIAELDAQIAAASRRSRFSARLQTMPGVGPITSMALAAFAPPMESFRQGREFSAWLRLVPRQWPAPSHVISARVK